MVKLPLMMPLPPRIGVADHRRGDDLVVEHDGEALADILRGRVAELAGAHRVELEGHRRQIALVVALLRIGQALARHQDPLFQRQRGTILRIGLRHQNGSGRQRRRAQGVLVHHLEGELCFRLQQALDLLRIADARHLDDDAVLALADDGRLAGSGLVDAAAHDLDRLFDRAGPQLLQPGFGETQSQGGAGGVELHAFADDP